MLCEYEYQTNLKEYGSFQCDFDDFKNFIRYFPEEITSLIVRFDNGNIWLWTPLVEKNGRQAGGWEFVKNKFCKEHQKREIIEAEKRELEGKQKREVIEAEIVSEETLKNIRENKAFMDNLFRDFF